MRSLSDLVTIETARFQRRLIRWVIALSFAAFALGVILEGLVIVLVGGYVSLVRVMPPWQAGLIVGGAVILSAAAVVAFAVLLSSGNDRSAAATAANPASSQEPPAPNDSAMLLKVAADRFLERSGIKTGDLMLSALAAGFVLVASSRLRQRFFERQDRIRGADGKR
jgi:hypothetical protein